MPRIHPSAVIHPSALVAETAHIGEGCVIAAYAVIEGDVFIGPRCQVDSFGMVLQYTRMGADNHIFSHAYVGGLPQDLKFAGEESWLELGNGNRIREFATIHRGTAGGGGTTRIGSNNLIMAYAHVAHDCQIGNTVVLSNNASLAGHVSVDDFAILGGLSAVHQFCRIGRNAFLGGASGIGQDLPPFMLASGSRARVVSPNLIGLRRMGASAEAISALKIAFRLFWHSELPRREALEQLEREYGQAPEIAEFVRFVRSSERGILSADKGAED